MAKEKTESELTVAIKELVYDQTQHLPQILILKYAEAWLLGPLDGHAITDKAEWLEYLKSVYGE